MNFEAFKQIEIKSSGVSKPLQILVDPRICFPPIFSNKQSLTQSFDRSSNVNFENKSIANPILVPSVTKALNSKPFGFAQSPRFVTKPKQGTSSSKNKRKGYLQKEYQRNLPLLSHMPDDQAQSLFTTRPGISGIADVLGDKLIQLNAL